MSGARYSIGIDLGTTHCALSYVDTAASDGEKTTLTVLPIAQSTGPGAIADLDLLPSFLYLPHPDELASGACTCRGPASASSPSANSRAAAVRPPRSGSFQRKKLAVPSGRPSPRVDLPNHAPPKSHACRRSKARCGI